MRLTELTRRVSLQQLYRVGHYTDKEIFEMKKDGWYITWRESPIRKKRKSNQSLQLNKNGIPVKGAV